MANKKEFEFEPVILVDGVHIIEIDGFVCNVDILPSKVEDIDPTKAYIVCPFVLPVIEEEQVKNNKPGILVNKEKGTYKIYLPVSAKDIKDYSTEKIRSLGSDINNMVQEMINNPDNFRSEKESEIINLNSSVTTYTINEDDDFLKKAIKEAINAKGINVKSYADKLPKAHDMNNTRNSLKDDKKMTLLNLTRWCTILGLECSITLRDNGQDKIRPLPNDITITFNE